MLARIAAAAQRSNRQPDKIRLMAVTKTLQATVIDLALECDISLFGENRVQEALAKYAEIKRPLELHLIGHLQRNKAKAAAGLFDWVDSIDKDETAIQLDKWAGVLGRKIDVLLEVNTSGEDSKFGVRDDETLWRLAANVMGLANLRFRGLMTVGPFSTDTARIRSSFARLRRLFETARERLPEADLNTLSMGMSGDYEIAVEEGSTQVRVGTAIFGARRTV